MPLSTQEYFVRLRVLHAQLEQLSDSEGRLPTISEQQLTRVLQYAALTVPEFEQCWNDISVWIDTMTTFLEHYHTLASELLEEEDTVKLSTLASMMNHRPETPTMPAQQAAENIGDYEFVLQSGGDSFPS